MTETTTSTGNGALGEIHETFRNVPIGWIRSLQRAHTYHHVLAALENCWADDTREAHEALYVANLARSGYEVAL